MTNPQPIDAASQHECIAADGSIAVDAACLGCEYNLRGMDPQGGACPECGKRVAESFDLKQLRFAPVEKLRRIRSLIRSPDILLLIPGVMFFVWLYTIGSHDWVVFRMMFALAIAAPAGLLWLYLPQETADRDAFPLYDEPRVAFALDRVLQWRRVAAITLIVVLISITFVARVVGDFGGSVIELSLVAMAYVTASASWATLLLLSELARRFPAESAARWLQFSARLLLMSAQTSCGAFALGALWSSALGDNSGCLSDVAHFVALTSLAIGGPVATIVADIALGKFLRVLGASIANRRAADRVAAK